MTDFTTLSYLKPEKSKPSREEHRRILGLQPRDKAAMLGVKTKETFLEEFA